MFFSEKKNSMNKIKLDLNRHDSTIPIHYSKWIYYDPRITHMHQMQNFAANKTKKVAWLVSNCEAHNDRDMYVRELQKYIEVTIKRKSHLHLALICFCFVVILR